MFRPLLRNLLTENIDRESSILRRNVASVGRVHLLNEPTSSWKSQCPAPYLIGTSANTRRDRDREKAKAEP